MSCRSGLSSAEEALEQLSKALAAAEAGDDPLAAVLAARSAADAAISACGALEANSQPQTSGTRQPTVRRRVGTDELLRLEKAPSGRTRWVFLQDGPPFEICETAGKGVAMFAARELRVGERVIAERPLVRWRVRRGESQDGRLRSFARVVDALDAPTRSAFLALSQADHLGDGDARGQRTMMGTWLTNALPINYEAAENDEHDEGAVFSQISRINHACVPNCHHEWNASLGRETVQAIAPIALGEEISINYLMPAGRTRTERQALLRKQFGFDCGCTLCSLPGDQMARSDACQRAIGALQPEHGLALSELTKRLEVRMSLMERECMPIIWARPLLLAAMVQSVQEDSSSAAGRERTRALHARALECIRISAGTDHPNYETVAGFLSLIAEQTENTRATPRRTKKK